MFKKLSPILCAAALAATATLAPVSASALEFKFTGAEVPPFVNVNYARTVAPKSKNGQGAGAFSFTDMTVAGTLGSFVAWCFDLDTTLSVGTHTYTAAPDLLDTTPPYLAGAKDRIQKLFDKSYDLDPTTGVLSSSANSAAFQLAIWEVLYDDDFNLGGTGNFTGSGATAAITTAANGYLAGLKDFNGPREWVITTYGSETVQDIGVATAIPLPAAAWLLLGVSGALVAGKRRAARRAA